jgi:alanine or glycine:cation symporter, AGCS family
MQQFMEFLDVINGVLWHPIVLYIVLGVGVLFTIWSGFSQYRALTHGTAVIRGKYDDKKDPGAINHFQALSAALSATVGLGNIGGVAVAVALGGPGAVFWMWIVATVGMSIKTTEVTLSMLYRDTSKPDEPHGGPMWVASKGFAKWGLKPLGVIIGGIFCITLLISTVTGGNMFQAWNVAEVTTQYFPTIPKIAVGIILAVVVGMVIIGGIKRIGAVAGRLVPFMCVLYLLAAIYVLIMTIDQVPAMLALIVRSAFSPVDATGAFVGGTVGYAFLWGMKRALFSNEAGQGSSPIAHSAAKTDEPVREGVVAGLEPFIDTIVVCTLTALVILSSGAWNRDAEARFASPEQIQIVQVEPGLWTLQTPSPLPPKTEQARTIARLSEQQSDWRAGETVFMLIDGDPNPNTASDITRIPGTVRGSLQQGYTIEWSTFRSTQQPALVVRSENGTDTGVYGAYAGASLTAHSFDRVTPGLGMWLVVLASWLFAISTMISWSYYGEQGMVYLLGDKSVLPYKLVYCLLIVVATAGWITTDAELDSVTALGTGVMLFANIPIMLIFGSQAMKAYHNYIGRLKSGEIDREAHANPPITDVVEGKDVE